MSKYQNSLAFAQEKDLNDPLKKWRDEFFIPNFHEKPVVYFTGNSLGLQPKRTQEHIQHKRNDWAKWGVDGHSDAQNPWFSYHELLTEIAAKIVAATSQEVVIAHSIPNNLHLLMVSFYQPAGKRIT